MRKISQSFFLLIGLLGMESLHAESLAQYAATCTEHVGGVVPTFNCLDGEIIPINGPEEGPCANPQTLNGQCWYNSRMGRLESGDSDVEVRFLCRHYNRSSGQDDPTFNDIAVIQRNKRTGATCFYQSPSGSNTNHDGSRVVSPSRGDTTIWQTPEVTVSQDCVACHDNGSGFIKTPFLKGLSETNGIPTPQVVSQYSFPGLVTNHWRAYQVKSVSHPTCSTCHNMGTSNLTPERRGTSVDIGLQSAGLSFTSGLAFGTTPWMNFDPQSAAAHKQCALDHNGSDCIVTLFDAFDSDDMSSDIELGSSGLSWAEVASLGITLNAGESLPRLVFRATGGSGPISYTHGHPEDECSWDNPHQEGNEMILTGTTPSSGRYTLSGKTIVSGLNFCRILLIARTGDESIEIPFTVSIMKNDGRGTGGIIKAGAEYSFKSRHSGKCLDIKDSNTSNGARLQQWGCNGESQQKFRLVDTGNGTFNVVSRLSGRCISADDFHKENGSIVQTWECNGNNDQKFRLTPNNFTGSYSLRFEHSGKCVDVSGPSVNNGAVVHQWECLNEADNQAWDLLP